MRIAHLTATFPPYPGGAGNTAHRFAVEQAARGHEVEVFTAPAPGDPPASGDAIVHRIDPVLAIGNAPLIPRLAVIDSFDVVHIHYPFIFGSELTLLGYLIGADGQVRFVHFGEGAYEETERAIRSLLAEAGDAELGSEARANTERIDPGLGTPETYLGFARAEGWVEPPRPGTSDYGSVPADELGLNEFAYSGRWRVDEESGTAVSDSAISLSFQARRVFLVLGSEDGPADVAVELDGEPISNDVAGEDVTGGVVRVSGQRLYRLVDLPEAGQHTLTLRFDPNVAGYAFTFG